MERRHLPVLLVGDCTRVSSGNDDKHKDSTHTRFQYRDRIKVAQLLSSSAADAVASLGVLRLSLFRLRLYVPFSSSTSCPVVACHLSSRPYLY